MTNEEAIKWTKWCISKDKECIQKTIERGFPAGEIQETLEYYEFVLRSLQSISVPTDEPLTLEQLREMDGQPVWIVESPDWGHWELSEDAEDYLCDRDTDLYGLTYPDPDGKAGLHKLGWLAYAYPPAHIDREAWESCPCCDAAKANSGVVNQALWVKEPEVNKWTLFGKKLEYCPICGRPLTEEAWAMLEKRLRG